MRDVHHCYTRLHANHIYQNRSPASCPAARGCGTSTAYSPNAAFKFAYGSVVVIWRTGASLLFAKPASSSSSSSSSPALPSRSSNPPSRPLSGGSGGAGLDAPIGSEEVPGSIGPGPTTTTGPDTGVSRWMGTRSCLDIEFSAGESTSALPAAPRINVWSDKDKMRLTVFNNGERGPQVGTAPLDFYDRCCPVCPCATTIGRALHDPCGLRPS